MSDKLGIPYFLAKELEKAIKEKQIRHRLMILGKCKTFKDFLSKKLHYVLMDLLEEKNVNKWDRFRYVNFARFCLGRILKDGLKFVDQIFDMAEDRFIERDGLDPEIVREIEVFLINYIHDAPAYTSEYEQIKRWYEGYVKELEKKGRRRL